MRKSGLAARLLPLFAMTLVPIAPASAGLFDFLEPSQPAPRPQQLIEQPRPAELPPLSLPQHAIEPHRHIIVVHRSVPDKALTLDHRSAALQKDATLREGDAIMTKNGIRVFAGTAVGEHGAGDFATLSDIKGLSPAERTALAEIDAHRSEEGWQSKSGGSDQLISGRSVAADTQLAWKWLRDPKGHLVRYVGP